MSKVNQGLTEWLKSNSSVVQALSTVVTTTVLVLTFIGTAVKNMVRWITAVVNFFRNQPKEAEQVDNDERNRI